MQPADALIAWFQKNARPLPWRTEPRHAYRTLVSEVMLQQTQVDRVVDRFEAFVARFPTVSSLAQASEEEVLALWSGLGYYRRARLLHRLAQVVRAEHGGVIPMETVVLRSLPGVGEYTAAALASMVFARAEPVVDGNVRRVGARTLAFVGDPRTAAVTRALKAWILDLMTGHAPGVVNEALMELGASLCSPQNPQCSQCPLAPGCRARIEGRTAEIPPPRTNRATEHVRWVAACCRRDGGQWLVRRVAKGPVLRGLWLPPLADLGHGDEPGDVATTLLPGWVGKPVLLCPAVSHSITHRRIDVIPVLFDGRGFDADAATWRWVRPGEGRLATSSLLEKLWKAVEKARTGLGVEFNALRQEK